MLAILTEDVGLTEGLSSDRRPKAESACLAPVLTIRRGLWEPGGLQSPDPGGFGLLIAAGYLCRRVGQNGRFGAELLGPGDLLRPWQMLGPFASIPSEPVWTIIADTRIAVLGEQFARRAAPFPEVASQLVGRALLRSRYLALNMAIVHHPKVEMRLHMLFWLLADRWGHVGPDGVAIEIALTHELLSDLVAARRPTVTRALSALQDQGTVRRTADGWQLHGQPPSELGRLTSELG